MSHEEMTEEEFFEVMQGFLNRFRSAAEDAVRRDHYHHDAVPDFDEKVEAKITSMVYYMIDQAARNAP